MYALPVLLFCSAEKTSLSNRFCLLFRYCVGWYVTASSGDMVTIVLNICIFLFSTRPHKLVSFEFSSCINKG